MIVGFTGTRNALDIDGAESEWIRFWLRELPATYLHHGDCVGADALAHRLALADWVTVVVHPPDNDTHRAFCTGGIVETCSPKPYLLRNRDIVAASEILLAVPGGPETLRSGTWSTIRYARNALVPIRIFPDKTPFLSGGDDE